MLRRAKVDVTVVGVQLEKDYAVCSRGVKVLPDAKFEDINIDAVRNTRDEKQTTAYELINANRASMILF